MITQEIGSRLAVVTGKRDISAAAKVVKTFGTELDRLKIHFGFLNNQRLEQAELIALADAAGATWTGRARFAGISDAAALGGGRRADEMGAGEFLRLMH